MKRARRIVPMSTFALALALGACAGSGGPSQPSPPPGNDGPFEPYAEVVKDAETHEGLFTVHVKDDLTLLLEVQPEQLDTDYGMVSHFSQGTGVYNLHDGLRVGGTRLIRFERHGHKLFLVERNPRFTAEPGSNMERSLEENTGHSILAAFDIEAQHDSTEALVIDVTGFFVGDFHDLAENIGFYHGNNRVSFDDDRSYLEQVMVFPENVEIDAMLTFEAGGPPAFSSGAGVSDYRSIPVGLRYSVFSLPEEPMQRRLADDRLGYFLSAQRDFSMDASADPYVRYVNRWRLEKANPDAEISEPVEPIVYYVDRSVPEQYRPYVKQGIEAWNKAYEAAGFRNAVVAMDPPDDPEWSAEDVRYSTVRWTAAHEMGYAIGPSQVDPRTGEILNADILISSTFVRGWNADWQEFIGPVEASLREEYPEIGYFGGLWGRLMAVEAMARELPPQQRERVCVAALGKAHQLGFQHAALAALGVLDGTEPMPEDYLGAAIRDLIMHEVGHTLGLRHNFKASAAIPFDRLNDEAFTRENGVYVSVMDYAPTNIATDRSEQGHFVNPEVGAYDVWVIQYGYMDVPGAETPEEELPVLRELAARASSDPLLTYNTDEDTHLGPLAVDPLSNTWDLSSDPVTYARSRAELVAMVKPELEARLIDEGEGWQRLRSAVPGMIFERYGSLIPVTKAVGGLYFHRDHKGQPEARMPFEPVDAERQREALAFIIDQAFAPGAFAFEAETLNKLAPSRWADWSGAFFTAPIDYPIHSTIAAVQSSLLGQLMHNGRLIRMIDNEVRMANPFTVAELFGTLTDQIWAEAGWSGRRATNVDSYRRNLQRMYTTRLIDKALDRVSGSRSSFNPSTPEDARSLARHELRRLSDRLGRVMNAGSLNAVTRAHFAETKVRIDQALEATLLIEGD